MSDKIHRRSSSVDKNRDRQSPTPSNSATPTDEWINQKIIFDGKEYWTRRELRVLWYTMNYLVQDNTLIHTSSLDAFWRNGLTMIELIRWIDVKLFERIQ